MKLEEALTGTQREIAGRVIDEEEVRRRHVVVALSGAHAYGFPSPDSDLDLKAIHVEPTAALLGLRVPRPAFDRLETIAGVEIDYTSNELLQAVSGILKGNGNFVERVLGPLRVRASPELEELASLVRGSLSRRLHAHYRGFAESQRRSLAGAPTVKRLLYVLRTTLTGVHALRAAEIVTDLGALAPEYGLSDVTSLIDLKKAGEKTPLGAGDAKHWEAEVARAFALLDEARGTSPLPETPPNAPALESWLLALRKRLFA